MIVKTITCIILLIFLVNATSAQTKEMKIIDDLEQDVKELNSNNDILQDRIKILVQDSLNNVLCCPNYVKYKALYFECKEDLDTCNKKLIEVSKILELTRETLEDVREELRITKIELEETKIKLVATRDSLEKTRDTLIDVREELAECLREKNTSASFTIKGINEEKLDTILLNDFTSKFYNINKFDKIEVYFNTADYNADGLVYQIEIRFSTKNGDIVIPKTILTLIGAEGEYTWQPIQWNSNEPFRKGSYIILIYNEFGDLINIGNNKIRLK